VVVLKKRETRGTSSGLVVGSITVGAPSTEAERRDSIDTDAEVFDEVMAENRSHSTENAGDVQLRRYRHPGGPE
jgi:hypothetical protein